MNINVVRTEVFKVYGSASWGEKLKNMSDDQVLAIYYRFKREGKIK